MSYVCPIHDRYVPDGERCKYCVEPIDPDVQPEGVASGAALSLRGAPGSIWGDVASGDAECSTPIHSKRLHYCCVAVNMATGTLTYDVEWVEV